MNVENEYITLGYYICKLEDAPRYLSDISEKLISVSDCLCNHEPQIFLCHGWKSGGDNEKYRLSCNLNMEQYLEMSQKITKLFSDEKFFTDGRFLNVKDAQYFHKKYFLDSQYILVSVIIKSCYLNALGKDFKIEEEAAGNDEKGLLGCDIIGWDISGFHSFLCNSLHEKYENIKFNSFGLLDMEYTDVEKMTLKIQGMGEPVVWVPVIIKKVI